MGAGFAGVHANEDVGGRMLSAEIGGEGAAGGEKSGVVEGRSAWNAANAVSSEKFFGHGELAARPRENEHTKV